MGGNKDDVSSRGTRATLGRIHASAAMGSGVTVAPPAARGPTGITTAAGSSQGLGEAASILTSRTGSTGVGATLDAARSSHMGAAAFARLALKSAMARQMPQKKQ